MKGSKFKIRHSESYQRRRPQVALHLTKGIMRVLGLSKHKLVSTVIHIYQLALRKHTVLTTTAPHRTSLHLFEFVFELLDTILKLVYRLYEMACNTYAAWVLSKSLFRRILKFSSSSLNLGLSSFLGLASPNFLVSICCAR